MPTVMRKFRIREISLVGSPAQEPARVVIAKSDTTAKPNPEPVKENVMPNANDANDALQKQLDEANAAIEHYKAVAALPHEQRVLFDGMEKAEQDAFLKLPDADRAEAVNKAAEAAKAKAADENPVIYTTDSGLEIRKSDGDVMAAIAKDADETRRRNADLEKRAKDAAFEKQAETELSHLPGTVAERAALLRAVDGIPDEAVRTGARNALKAHDNGLADAFKQRGAVIAPDDSPALEIEKMVAAYQKEHPDVSAYDAHKAVLASTEGAKAYADSVRRAQ